MKTQRLQAAFARKREAEHLRFEKNNAVNRYFDQWGKITSRYETWTAPEYYEQVEESLRRTRETELKNKQLQERREKLKELLGNEQKLYERELNTLRKPKPKKVSTDLLEKISKNCQDQEEERRRLRLESKLYSRLRYGITDETIMFQSNTNNQAFAKLNWLDKQIENQMQKEKEEKEALMLNLRLEEEARKREEYLKEREKLRESEIKELRALQETHMDELKQRELETYNLQKKHAQLRQSLEDIEAELNALKKRKSNRNTNIPQSYNLKRIKMIMRQRSNDIRKELRNDIDALRRVLTYCTDDANIRHLVDKFEMQYDLEIQKQSQIEAMYESEAKHNLTNWEEMWSQQNTVREMQIENILTKQKNKIEKEFAENIKQQKHLVEVQETHLSSIESANEKLKLLIKEEENEKDAIEVISEKNKSERADSVDSLRKALSRCEIREDSPVPPKFGRKKVAWT